MSMPTPQVDPVFEQARAAAMAGFTDADRAQPVKGRTTHHHLRPTG